MAPLSVIILVHSVTTTMMAGIIWFVQVVHYPLMFHVGKSSFTRYEREYMRRTTRVVAPLMILEAVSAAALLVYLDGTPDLILAAIGVILVVLIWISTATLQVPCHRELAAGFDTGVAARLITTNWIRTIAWTMRAVIAVAVPLMIVYKV